MERSKIVIIGAGVVGLAIATRLSEKYDDILVIEKHNSFGQETSSRNSEVIHASIYYPKHFLKGKLCLRGNEMLYDLCQKNDIPYKNCGKLIVASEKEQFPQLEDLLKKAKDNGAKGVRIIAESEIKELEPNITALKAILSPSSGIVDSHSLMRYLELTAMSNGVSFAYNHEVKSLEKRGDEYIIQTIDSDGNEAEIKTQVLVNSAGLHSDKICEMLGINTIAERYKISYHKGIYYRVNKKTGLFPNSLIYPLPPEEGSVGIHTCPDVAGGMRLGPHFIWSDTLDYSIDDNNRDQFFLEASKYLPFLEPQDISADSVGYMAAVQSPGQPMQDFVIKHEVNKSLDGFFNLVGIESPGLTSCMSIAEYIEPWISEYLNK